MWFSVGQKQVCWSYEPSGALRFGVILVEEGGRSPHIKIKLTYRSASTLVHPEMKSSCVDSVNAPVEGFCAIGQALMFWQLNFMTSLCRYLQLNTISMTTMLSLLARSPFFFFSHAEKMTSPPISIHCTSIALNGQTQQRLT